MTMSISVLSSAAALILASSPAQPRYLPTKIDVDVAPLFEESPAKNRDLEKITVERTGTQILDSLRQGLEGEGIVVGGDDASAWVSVRVEWKIYIDSHYSIQIVARGSDGARETIAVECEFCNESELAAKIAEQVPGLLPALRASKPSSPSGKPKPGEERDEPEDPEDPDGPKRKLGPTGWAGIGTGVLGAVGVGVGAVYLNRGIERTLAGETFYERERNNRPLGGSLAIAGGVLLVTGAVLVVVDQTVLHKRRGRRDRGVAVQASYFPSHGPAVAITGRF